MEGSREPPDMSDNDSSVGIGFLENTTPILLPIFPPSDYETIDFLGYHDCEALGFQDYRRHGES